MCGYGEDLWDAFYVTWRRARTAHRCQWCSARIEPGHLYRYTSGIWDREPCAYKHCARCALLMDELARRGKEPLLDEPCDEVLPPDDPVSAWAFETAEETQARAREAVEEGGARCLR